MSRLLGSSPHPGDAARAARNLTKPTFAALAVLIVVLSSGLMFISTSTLTGGAGASPALLPSAPVTHGDLLVGPGETYTIQPTGGVPVYYQGGNITVLSGGTLDVRNVSLSFVQFVGDVGTPQQRLSHIYTFSDAGTVNFYNSTLTTDVGVINAYAKLTVDVTGSMNLWHSLFLFPGWLTISGTSAELTLNDSTISGNPAVPLLIEPLAIQGDTEYAPSLLVTAGAQLNLFGSSVVGTYADNTIANGIPGPAPLSTIANLDLSTGGTGVNLTYPQLTTPTDSANLTLDWLYGPVGIAGGYVNGTYNNTGTPTATVGVTVWYEGTAYPLGAVALRANTATGTFLDPFSPALTTAINSAGLLGYLNDTGAFGLPAAISLNISAPSAGQANVTTAHVVLNPPVEYDLVATGAGTTVSGVDTSIGLTFGNLPASPLSQVAPLPWTSNKFLFESGATGYLGNLTIPSAIAGVFSTSAVLPDSSSTVYLYRWAEFNLTSESSGGVVEGAAVHVYYAYDNNQTSNATANALNDIAATNPVMWQYLQYWDGVHGVPVYGKSNATGQASLLLASSELTGSNVPGGLFLGGYHVGIRVAYVNSSTWINFAVSPYPTGVAIGTPGYGVADVQNVAVVTPAPAVAFLLPFNYPSSPLDLNTQYASSGTIFINGPGFATISVTATPVGGGTPVPLGSTGTAENGSFEFPWLPSLNGVLSPGTSYTITAVADYRGATATFVFPISYSVPSTTSPTSFLFQKYLGLPLWLWIAIAVAAVVAILVVLLIFRRQAAGKLVECGECGELIPEDATTCPKCGAEFEHDLVRCSRCSSTIPANSQFCPECSAQLLGTPGEGASDPERQAYADFTERFRAEGKKELGDNYTESAFWDWWKRQPTYVPFSQWKVQQNKGAPRAGMSQPPVGFESAPAPSRPLATSPPLAAAAPGAGPGFTAPPAAAAAPTAPGGGALKPCPNCGKEIPPEYLVCPFCGAVTQ
ncbi:MAG: zinc-ribbon domain-containing protein [Thermoplasmata archaeon]